MVFIDIEVYRNYFLFCATDENGETEFVDYHGNHLGGCFTSGAACSGQGRGSDDKASCQLWPRAVEDITRVMEEHTTVSFNGLSYDLPLIAYALQGATNNELKELSDAIIKSNMPSWQVVKEFGIHVPSNWDHIDLINVAPGVASLKAYGGRMNAQKMQDLPIEPDAIITEDQRAEMISYCFNDCNTTELLYKKLTQQVLLREKMSQQYGLDLRSKSDAQVAEHIIKSEVGRLTGKTYYKPTLADDYAFNYVDPKIIKFKTKQLDDIFKRILDHEFTIAATGKVSLPDFLKTQSIEIGDSKYKMGVGGLHSCEKDRVLVSGDECQLIDLDVASYYPSIILQQNLAPKSFGAAFLSVYHSLVKRRLGAKRSGDKVAADTLKIAVNGIFGKLGSKWSPLYAPELLIQTTITGQLALLMLIESLELAGLSVVSANTDGIIIKCTDEGLLDEISFDWMLETTYLLEWSRYHKVISRDINNYIAIKNDGSVKTKGIFTPPSLAKNPDMPIIYAAVVKFFSDNTPLQQTIESCADICKFVSVRKVTGGAVWGEEMLGKAVRFYYSRGVDRDESIRYAKNSNKVPKSDGARPLMDLPDHLPDDIDYVRYTEEAQKLVDKLTK